MVDGILRFSCLTANSYWSLLEDANKSYISIGHKYHMLFRKLENDGVAFADIRNFLMNEAKRAGLLEKRPDNNGNMNWPSRKVLKALRPAWYHQLGLFLQWVERNYVSYKVEVKDPRRKKEAGVTSAPAAPQSTTRVTETRDGEGNTRRIEETTTGSTATAAAPMNGPVASELSSAQVMAIIQSNWSVLEEYCSEKGASEQFEALMEALDIE